MGDPTIKKATEFEKVFAQNQLPTDMPEIKISSQEVAIAKLIANCKLVSSGGEAKRLIAQGGVTVDGEKITTPNHLVIPADGMIIRVGKRKFAKLLVD